MAGAITEGPSRGLFLAGAGPSEGLFDDIATCSGSMQTTSDANAAMSVRKARWATGQLGESGCARGGAGKARCRCRGSQVVLHVHVSRERVAADSARSGQSKRPRIRVRARPCARAGVVAPHSLTSYMAVSPHEGRARGGK